MARKAGLAALMLVALLLLGCGGSSSGRSTASSAAKPLRQPSIPGHASQPSAPSTSASAGTVVSSARGVTATLHAGTHQPKVGRPWPIHFTVIHAGRPARASVSYQYLFNGQVVAHRSHYTFTGRFSDTFEWPASAVGYPLTFRAVIVSAGATIDLDYAVQVAA